MKKIFTLLLGSLCIYSSSLAQPVLAQWTFETADVSSTAGTTPNVTVGTPQADAGVKASGSSFTGFHASALTVWSTPAGNGSANALSSNNWGVNDYYQFQLSTTGYSGLQVSFDQTGSNTGPSQFKLQYSTDGTTFTDVPGGSYTIPSNGAAAYAWSASTPISQTSFNYNLSSIAALNNAANVYFRLTNTSTVAFNGGTVATAGTNRVDNFTVSGFTIFPLTLVSFAATLSDNKVNVEWTSANELNVAGYEIQRSINGKDFMPITLVDAENAGTTKNYTYTDPKAVAGTSFYRLKMTDKDGSYKYSQIATIKNSIVGVSLYPNPVRSNLTIQHESAEKGATVSVMGMSGKQIVSVNVLPGAVQTTIDAAKLAPGVYMIVYTNNGQKQTKQFVKE
jgi:hypothetical protein